MHRISRTVRLLIAATVTVPAISQMAPAFAQIATDAGASTAPTAQSGPSQLQEIVVSGTHIVSNGYHAPTPVTVLGKDTLEAMGKTNIADAINQLPQMAQSVTPSSQPAGYGGGTIGVNELNLRSLGASRTLVLLDGKRIVDSDINTAFAAPDVNTVPSALVSRVDVVTGGASAVYGSDALAGVVNFVLDHNFKGIKGDLEGGTSNYGDDNQLKVSLTMGTAFGADSRGHFEVSGELTDDGGIVGNNRPWNADSAAVMQNPNWTATNGQPYYLVAREVGLSNATPGGLITSGPLKGIAFGPNGTPTTFNYGLVSANNEMSGGDWEYSRIDNHVSIDPPLRRENVFSRLSFDLTDNVQLYSDFQWSSTNAHTTAIPNRALGCGTTIYADNAFLPPTIKAQMAAINLASFCLGSTNGDTGLVEAVTRRTLTRGDIGGTGQFALLGTKWRWDTYYQHSQEKNLSEAANDLIHSNYALATDAVINPATGAIECRSTLTNPGNGCVPYDAMGTGVNSRAAIDYITGVSHINDRLTEDDAVANLSGAPFSTWAGPVSLAFGVEHRREAVTGQSSILDDENAYGLGDYHATLGSYNVTEGSVETVIPLAQDLAWAKSLDINAAARETSYSTSGRVTTWKFGGVYQPVEDVRFRATRSRDIRAPGLGELFAAGQASPGAPLYDPFTNTQLPAVIGLASGNAELKPEVANTTEFGAVFTPEFFPRFAASIDYYKIDISNAVLVPSTQSVVNLCYQGITSLCSDIQRTAGVISLVVTSPSNIASQSTDGVDFEASYRLPLADVLHSARGVVSIRALGTYISSLKSYDPTLGIVTQGAGVLGGRFGAFGAPVSTGLSAPKLVSTVFLNYDLEKFSTQLIAHYVGSGVYNNAFASCSSGCPLGSKFSINDNHIASNTVLGLSFTYRPVDEASVFLSINNILNTYPPVIGGNTVNAYYEGQANSDYYDRIGRTFLVGVRFQL